MTPQSILSGLVDYRPWARTYEGPYSRACKLGTLNVLGAAGFCRLVFAKELLAGHARPFHGRSLLAGPWLRESNRLHPLARSVVSTTLDKMCGHWAPWIASDAQVRYCPDCMVVGFQSVVHQIDGIEVCPLHATAILDSCQDCGHPLPAYAVTPETLDSPLCCSKCFSPFSRAWEASALLECRELPFDERPFALMHSWLRRLGGLGIEWPALSAWHPSHATACPLSEVRQAVFSTLIAVLPCPIRQEGRAQVAVLAVGTTPTRFTVALPALDETSSQCLCSIYKAIRRHVRRLLRRASPALFDRGVDMALIDWNTLAPLPESQGQLTDTHAWFLWRKRFEATFWPMETWNQRGSASKGDCSLRLRADVLSWPAGCAARPSEWGHFTWQCFLADRETARGWASALASLAPVATGIPVSTCQRSAAARFNEVYAAWAARLDPELQPWPQSLSHLTRPARSDDERELVLVGTPASI